MHEKDEVICIIGYLNAQVRESKKYHVVGELWMAEMKDIEECSRNKLTVCMAPFKEREIHKNTWIKKVRTAFVESQFMDFKYRLTCFKVKMHDANVTCKPVRYVLSMGGLLSFGSTQEQIECDTNEKTSPSSGCSSGGIGRDSFLEYN